jgi:hypothetical protein
MYEENTTEMIEALAKDLRKVSSHNLALELNHIFGAAISVYSK